MEPTTLEIYENLEQGTQEWLDVRIGILTASDVGKFITPKTLKIANNQTSRDLTQKKAIGRIIKWEEPTPQTLLMRRGKLDEPLARELYSSFALTNVTEIGFMKATFTINGKDMQLGYSPDGLIGDNGLIEIKSRSPHMQFDTLMADKVPLMHMAQLQTGLLVSGRQWIDYVSFCGGMALYVERVYPNKQWQKVILQALERFEDTIESIIEAYTAKIQGLPIADVPLHYYPEEVII